MPYRRSSYRRRRVARRRPVRRRPRNSIRRRPVRRRRMMTRKRLLNVTSTKRSDTMLSFSNTLPTGAVNATTINNLTVLGNRSAVSLWCATARTLGNAAQAGNPTWADNSDRMSQTVFMRGLSEHVNVQTNSGLPWQWRRICFAVRTGAQSLFNTPLGTDSPTQSWVPYADSSVGMGRLWFDENLNAQPNTVAAQFSVLFKGTVNQDWNNVITAAVDTARVDLKYDKTISIFPNNSSGTLREHKLWHPMNKNLTYADDEQGVTEVGSYYSVTDKRGMGDYYVMDFIVPAAFGTTQDVLNIGSTSRLYWHEK